MKTDAKRKRQGRDAYWKTGAEGKKGSPKLILKTAFGAGMTDNEALWLYALESGNHVAHAYDEAIALEIVRDAKARYLAMCAELKAEIETNRLETSALPWTIEKDPSGS